MVVKKKTTAPTKEEEAKDKDSKEGVALPSEAPGAVVCGNTVTNSNGTAYFNIATNDNHGDHHHDGTNTAKRQALPTAIEESGSSVNAGGGIYYFCTMNYYYGTSSSTREENPVSMGDEGMHGRKRARVEDHDDADHDQKRP
eukprot:jgi/Picsp_1/5164/NSC_02527-R1_---NA---